MFSPIRPSSKLVEYLLVATLGLIGLTGLYAATVYFSHQSDKQTLAMEHPFQAGLEEIAQIELMPEDLKTAGLPQNPSHPCLMVLDPTSPGSLEMYGSSSLIAPGCAIRSRSNSKLGVILQDVEMLEVAGVQASGPIDHDLEVFGMDLAPYSSGLEDPFADHSVADSGACDHRNLTLKSGQHKLVPGVYCGGIVSLTAQDIQLDPGTYIIKNGPLVIGGRTSFVGDGVTLVFEGANAVFSFGVATRVALKAPVTGPNAGFAIIEKTKSSAVRDFIIRSYDARLLEGAIYLPKGRLIIDNYGRVGEASNWTTIVANQGHIINGAHLQLNSNHIASDIPLPADSKKTGESMIASIE